MTMQQVSSQKFCSACGNALHIQAAMCPRCGVPQIAPQIAITKIAPSRGVAVVLALFLGGLGVHKFYLGKPVWGLFYLIFCWTFIPAVFSLLEAIVYLCTSEATWQREYGSAQ